MFLNEGEELFAYTSFHSFVVRGVEPNDLPSPVLGLWLVSGWSFIIQFMLETAAVEGLLVVQIDGIYGPPCD